MKPRIHNMDNTYNFILQVINLLLKYFKTGFHVSLKKKQCQKSLKPNDTLFISFVASEFP